MLNIAHLLKPLELALRAAGRVAPCLLGVNLEDTNIKFRELLALAVRQGGLGICNLMLTAEKFYNTLPLDLCSCLVETIAMQEKLDHVRHTAQVAKARMSASCVV